MRKSISILGTGWLGLPLTEHFVLEGYCVNASTTSKNRMSRLSGLEAKPFILDIETPSSETQSFLHANILIINITSKNPDAFSQLLTEIERSKVERVLFVSSTSVYEKSNRVIMESDGLESKQTPLSVIEAMFRYNAKIKTTIVRFGGLVGYGRHPGRFFRSGTAVKNADSNVNLIHHDDCVGIIAQIVAQEVWGEVFNCCADTHPTKREFYTQVIQSIGAPLPEFIDSAERSFKIVSNQKVKRVLDYEFVHADLMKIRF